MLFRKLRSKSGATVLETAAMLPFVYLLIGMIFTGGQLVMNKQVANTAAYGAARKAVVSTSLGSARTIARDKAKELGGAALAVDKNNISTAVNMATAGQPWKKGNMIKVTVTLPFKTMFPIVSASDSDTVIPGDSNYALSSSAVVMIEND